MSKQKITTENIQFGVQTGDPGTGSTNTVPDRQLEVLSLELEEDAGGDPYNRTGQFCVIDLKNKAQ